MVVNNKLIVWGAWFLSDFATTQGGPSGDAAELWRGDNKPSRYVMVADFLRKMIYNHEIEPGEKIPSEHQLMDQFDIARGTARHAIKILAEEGLLKQSHGRGTFVSFPDITHNVGNFPLSLAQSLTEQGKSFTTHVVRAKIKVPPPAMQVALDIRPGYGAFYIERVRVVDGSPILCQEDWVSTIECPGIATSNFERETMFDAIERCSGRKVKSSTMTYSARNAGPKYAPILGCDETTAVLVLEQVVLLNDNRPASWGRTWFKPGQTVTGTTSI